MTSNMGSDAFRSVTVPGATPVEPVAPAYGVPSTQTSGGQSSTAQEAKGQAADVAGTAKDKAADVAGTAKDKAADVAGTAKDKAADVAGTAKEKVTEVTQETARQVRHVFDEAKTELSGQAETQQGRLAEVLRSVGGELSTLAKDSSADGMVTQAARRAGDTVQQAAGWLEDRDPASVLDEVRSFARRRPGAFLALALGAGVLAGRLTRGLRDAASDDNSSPVATGRPAPALSAAPAYPAIGAGTPAYGTSVTAEAVPAAVPGGVVGGLR